MNETDRHFLAANGAPPENDAVAELSAAVKALSDGHTPWQASVDRRLRTISNEVLILMGARIVWPSLAMLSALFMGGFAGELIFRLVGIRR